MAVHQTPEGMAIEAIKEYLAIAEYCVNTTKPGSEGVYGYPAVLLLFSVLDALSNYLGHPKNSFGALKTLQPQLSDRQVKQLKDWYRNLPSHQAMIMPGTKLSLDEGDPFDIAEEEPIHIRVRPFYRLVKNAWGQFDRAKITAQFHPSERPQHPINLAGTPASSLASTSGAYVTPRVKILPSISMKRR